MAYRSANSAMGYTRQLTKPHMTRNEVLEEVKKYTTRKVESYQSRVERGARWLSEFKPNWHKDIKLSELDLSSVDVCVLGQTFENFLNVVKTGIDKRGNEMPKLTEEQAMKLGFQETPNRNDYDLLTALWYQKIKDMRAEKAIA